MDFSSLLAGGGFGTGISDAGVGATDSAAIPQVANAQIAPINTSPVAPGGAFSGGGPSGGSSATAAPQVMTLGGGNQVGMSALANGTGPGMQGTGPGGAQQIPQMNTLSGGGSIGAGLADSFKAIGNAIANVDTDKAYGQFQYAAQPPSYRIQPTLATFAMPNIR